MRHSKVNSSSSLASASASASAVALKSPSSSSSLPALLVHRLRFQNSLCSVLRFLAIGLLIGTLFSVALATTSESASAYIESASASASTAATATATAAAATATATATATAIANAEEGSTKATKNNNLYFDAFNTTRTISTTAVDVAATTLYVSQMPAKTMPQADTSPSTNPNPNPYATFQHPSYPSSPSLPFFSSTRSYQSQSSIELHAGAKGSSTSSSNNSNSSNNNNNNNKSSSSTSIKNPSVNIGNDIDGSIGGTVQLPDGLTTAVVTLKSARSTSKQPNDSTRSRNHWVVGVVDSERPRTFRSKHHHEHHWGPFFEEPLNSASSGDNFVSTAHLFTEAVLNCRVGMLKDKTVMWVRRTTEKVSLLTVGNVTYSGDPRIRVKFQYPNNWRLLINPTKREDAGIYMCQVSTHPPRVFTTNLTILEPPLRIIDEHERDVGDRYYKSGSTVDLQCQVSRNFFQKERYSIIKSSEPLNLAKWRNTLNGMNETTSEFNSIANANQTYDKLSNQMLEKYFTDFVTWAKDEEPLQALTSRRTSATDKWLNSRISIPDAKLSDSGNYSCSLGRLFTVIVQVQVLTGELPAAVQHNRSTNGLPVPWTLFYCIMLLLALHRNRAA